MAQDTNTFTPIKPPPVIKPVFKSEPRPAPPKSLVTREISLFPVYQLFREE